jgi:hypothetical protein
MVASDLGGVVGQLPKNCPGRSVDWARCEFTADDLPDFAETFAAYANGTMTAGQPHD